MVSRRPLCIDSRLVEKIDIVTSQGQETVWACYLRKSVTFSPYLHEMLPHIKDRLRPVEDLLKVVGPLRQPARLEIFLGRPWAFEVLDHSIYLGEQVFLSRGHLEKALLKIWYREQNPDAFAYNRLAEEIMTDFLFFLMEGDLKIEDRRIGMQTRITGSRWPQVIKSVQSYCDSPWKVSEHYQICFNKRNLEEFLAEDVLSFSLRPLISASLIESYQQLSFNEKNEVLRQFSQFISSQRVPPLDLIGAFWESHPSAILMGRHILKEVQEYMFRSEHSHVQPSYKRFVSYFTESLRKRGFEEATSEVYFDFIYESASTVNPKSDFFKDLQKLSENRKDLQVALVDGKSIWFLPSTYPLDLNLFNEIKSRHRMVETCGAFDFGFVLKYAEKAEKLVAVETCGKNNPQRLESYLSQGVEGFARANKNLSFVQFHLPSLMLKSEFIPPKENVIALIQNRDISSPILQTLGWQELNWDQGMDAYRPKAQVEAIQWFRF